MNFAVVLLIITVVAGPHEGGASTTIIHPERAQLFKDAVGWMTFRKKGKLMTDPEVEPLFVQPLKDKYTSSDFYRTFVIAFLYGVVPRLTLNLNDPCDPSYTSRYKDSFNNSVTWHFQKKFTFQNYDNRKSQTIRYCDYRQGLICKSSSKRCQCPEGSQMEPIAPGSTVERCLVQENEICALIDIDHGTDPTHSALASNLYHLAFNLEKPPSCKDGTTYRFKSTNLTTPLCYDVASSGSFAPPYTDTSGSPQTTWTIGYGSECTLDLYANPGSCRVAPKYHLGTIHGFVCYNFGPPKSQSLSTNPDLRTGFCAHEYGPFGLVGAQSGSNGQIDYDTFFSPYIHPRTVPLRGEELEDYMNKTVYTNDKIGHSFGDPHIGSGSQAYQEGDRCNIQRTKKWEELWTYYSSLEKDPPPGHNYVPKATKADLDLKLQEFIALTTDNKIFCKVFDSYFRRTLGSSKITYPSLKCVSTSSTDSDGNDGKCMAPGNIPKSVTLPYAEKHQKALDHFSVVGIEQGKEKKEWRKLMLRENPEHWGTHCSTNPRSKCPSGTVCYKDYNDIRNIYDQRTCDLKVSASSLSDYCHDNSSSLKYGTCEEEQLDEIVFEEFEKMVDYSKLGRGEECDFNTERDIRKWIKNGRSSLNKYNMLEMLTNERKLGPGKGKGFCDRTKFLKCTSNRTCECVKDTKPRNVTVDGMEYLSDYCYIYRGYCAQVVGTWAVLTNSEEKELRLHYGHCAVKGNRCLFVGSNPDYCTEENTGNTGYNGTMDSTTTTESPATTEEEEQGQVTIPGGGGAGGPGYRFAGQGVMLRESGVLFGLNIIMMAFMIAS